MARVAPEETDFRQVLPMRFLSGFPEKQMATSYREKLRDPRWQQKRLRIMERDNWACRECGEKTATLNVHHRVYVYGQDPWDYEDSLLVTLCEDCHETQEAVNRPLADLFHAMWPSFYGSEEVDVAWRAHVIREALSGRELSWRNQHELSQVIRLVYLVFAKDPDRFRKWSEEAAREFPSKAFEAPE